MDTYFEPLACMRQDAIDALNRWAEEGKMLVLLFIGGGQFVYFCSAVERIEMYEHSVVFHGPDKSSVSSVLPNSENEGYLWFGVPAVLDGDVLPSVNQPITRESVLAELALAGVPCIEIGTESGCLIAYELLAVATPFPTIQ